MFWIDLSILLFPNLAPYNSCSEQEEIVDSLLFLQCL